ncbi:restriction endonuclease subunit S [Flexistipes sp.]|uniref:restriction endonuclease subunit S n=1 Tax=Flexistipes sp. TaxID=3088135 RepID=UPI002E1F2CC2|nr:restriction endonuclease subunit S [Flexistipes sp.]
MIELGKVLYRLSNSIDPQKKQGNVNYVGLENIEPNTGRLIGDIETKYQNIKSAKTYFEPDQVLYGKLRPNLNKVFYTNFHGICSTDIFVLQGNRNKANHKFYSYYLRSKLFNDKVLQGLGGAQLPRVSWNYLSNIQVPLPSLKVQKQIVEEIETEQKIVNSNKKLIGKMEQKIEAKISEVWGDKN